MHITELKSTKNGWDSICHRGGIRVYCENCETGDRTNDGITQIQYAAIGARIRSRRLEMGLTQAAGAFGRLLRLLRGSPGTGREDPLRGDADAAVHRHGYEHGLPGDGRQAGMRADALRAVRGAAGTA